MRAAASALLLMMSAPLLAQSTGPAPTSSWWRDYANLSRQVPIGGGRTLHLLCQGSGSPTIILESGTGDGMTVWRKVQPPLAQHYRVCAYDRAGLGLSPPDLQHRDLNGIASDLGKLATRAHLPPPYVLVSHSFGGMIARVFARRRPADVIGLVLVDPPIEHQMARISKIIPSMTAMTAKQIADIRACATARERTGDCMPQIPDDVPPPIAASLKWSTRSHFLTAAAEMEAATTGADDREMDRSGTDLGRVPLIVLTSEQFKTNEHMPPQTRQQAQALWTTFHDEIAAHSTRGVNRVVPGTGHYIQLERPDVVISAVEELAASAGKR